MISELKKRSRISPGVGTSAYAAGKRRVRAPQLVCRATNLLRKSCRWGDPLAARRSDRSRRPRRPLVLMSRQSRTKGSGANDGFRPTSTFRTNHWDRRLGDIEL